MTIWHYLLLGVLVTLAVRQAIVVIRVPAELVGPGTVVTAGAIMLYVVSYFGIRGGDGLGLFSYDGYLRLLFLCVLAVVSYLIGYGPAPRDLLRIQPQTIGRLDAQLIQIYSIGLLLVGGMAWIYFVTLSGGIETVYGSAHASDAAWEETTAYLYQLRYFFYPGLFLLFSVFVFGKGKRVPILIGFCGFALAAYDAWLLGSRGTYITLLLVVTVPLVLCQTDFAKRGRKALWIILPAMLLLVVLTPYIRIATFIGAEVAMDQVIERLSDENPLAGSSTKEGNELIYASGLMNAAKWHAEPDFGIEWLYPFVAFVPRFLWPDKPYWLGLQEYVFREGRPGVVEMIFASEGWVVPPGSAITGLLDGFLRFSWLSPLVWLLLGLWGGALMQQARKMPSIRSLGYLCAYLLGLVYWITQDFKAAFYAWFYFFIPIWLCGVFMRLVRTVLSQSIVQHRALKNQ